MFKRLWSCLLIVFLLMYSFSVLSFAGKITYAEGYNVEFKVLPANNFDYSVKVELTNTKDQMAINVMLHYLNDYFTNETIPPGEYSVKVSVVGREDADFYFYYDKTLLVEPSAVAATFDIIIDDASLGDESGSEFVESTPNPVSESAQTDASSNVLSTDKVQDVTPSSSDKKDVDNTTLPENSPSFENTAIPEASPINPQKNIGFDNGWGSLFVSFCFSIGLILIAVIVMLWIKKHR